MNIKVKTALRVILIGTTVLPLVVIALVTVMQVMGFASSLTGDEANNAGAALSAGISNITGSYVTDVGAYANMEMTNKTGSLPTAELDSLYASMSEDKAVLDLVVSDASGQYLYSAAGKPLTTNISAIAGSDKKTGVRVSKFSQKNATYNSETVFAVTAPLKDASAGSVSVIVNADSVLKCIKERTFLTHGFAVVADADNVLNYNGTDIGSADALYADINTTYDFLRQNGSGKAGTVLSTGGKYIGSYGIINNSDWVWLALYDAGEVNGSVMTVLLIGLGVIAVLIVVCVIVMILSTQKVIDPMINMLGTMKEINSGNHSERINTAGMGKEFAAMSDVFNTMMDESLMSEELHKTVSDLSDNMLFEWDFAKESMFVSDNFKAKIKLDLNGATLNNGKFLDSLMDEDDSEKYKRDMNTLFKEKGDIGNEYKLKLEDEKEIWVSMRARCVTDRLGEVLRVIGVLTDITSEKNATLKLAERASFDFLSQLYNRNTFEREFAAELERSVGKKVAALFIDVDDFKFINDRYSHAVGDETIRFVADTIKARTGETGFAGRFGGDEFVLCISDPKLVENVEVLSMDIIDDLYAGYFSKSVNTTLNIKASIGIAIYPDHSKDGKELVGCADAAMYFVKKNGKANYHIYEPSDSALEGNFMSSI